MEYNKPTVIGFWGTGNSQQRRLIYDKNKIAPTVQASWGMGGGNVPSVLATPKSTSTQTQHINHTLEDTTQAILDLLDKSLPSHKRQVHVEHGEIMPSVAQCKWYFDGYEQAIADVRKVIKEEA